MSSCHNMGLKYIPNIVYVLNMETIHGKIYNAIKSMLYLKHILFYDHLQNINGKYATSYNHVTFEVYRIY